MSVSEPSCLLREDFISCDLALSFHHLCGETFFFVSGFYSHLYIWNLFLSWEFWLIHTWALQRIGTLLNSWVNTGVCSYCLACQHCETAWICSSTVCDLLLQAGGFYLKPPVSGTEPQWAHQLEGRWSWQGLKRQFWKKEGRNKIK